MTFIEIYFEGGGPTASKRLDLRRSMTAFIGKAVPSTHGAVMTVVACGSRSETYKRFKIAYDQHIHESQSKTGDTKTYIILLVDSEGPVGDSKYSDYLTKRPDDKWNLSGVPEDHIHLMVQTMESWIIADPGVLEKFYGQNFNRNELPKHSNLDEVSKEECEKKLSKAIRHTRKNKYDKIEHARALLFELSPRNVRQRCPSAERLFTFLEQATCP